MITAARVLAIIIIGVCLSPVMAIGWWAGLVTTAWRIGYTGALRLILVK